MKNPFTFHGKNAVVIGGGAVGDATAQVLAAAGANLLWVSKSSSSGAAAYLGDLTVKLAEADIAKPKLNCFPLDITDPAARQSAVHSITTGVIEAEGGLDLLVITSGGINKDKAHQTKRTAADPPRPKEAAGAEARQAAAALWTARANDLLTERLRIYQTNVIGPMAFIDELSPALMKQDRPCCVVTICSAAPNTNLSGVEIYSEAKAALEVGTSTWNAQIGRARAMLGLPPHRGIPLKLGWVIGEQNREALLGKDGRSPTWRFEKILARHPSGDISTPEEAGWAILALSCLPYFNGDPIAFTGGALTNAGI